MHPHGIHCWPLNVFAFADSPFDARFPGLAGTPKLVGIVASVMFAIPVVREIFLAMGYVDARRAVCDDVLAAGKSLYVCPASAGSEGRRRRCG